MRRAVVPNTRSVGTRSNRATSSSIDIKDQLRGDESLIESYHGTNL
jgi:hypothetical protein